MSCDGGKAKTAESIERDVRFSLPVGSTLPAVLRYLGEQGIAYHFDKQSKTVRAVVRRLRGSNVIVRKDLLLKFHFDDSLKLVSIDATIGRTGP